MVSKKSKSHTRNERITEQSKLAHVYYLPGNTAVTHNNTLFVQSVQSIFTVYTFKAEIGSSFIKLNAGVSFHQELGIKLMIICLD